MPIRINLLAEAQALEELRRRDPVKRAIWAGGLLVAIVLGWSGWLQFQAVMARKSLSAIEAQLTAQNKEYRAVCDKQGRLVDVTFRCNSLRQLATNRLLNGTLLNALQQTAIENVQLARFKVDQSYLFSEEVKPKTNDDGVVPGRPASVTESIRLTMEARDHSPNGDQVNPYMKKILDIPYFRAALLKTNGVKLTSPPAAQSMGKESRPFVLFTLECRFPEKTR